MKTYSYQNLVLGKIRSLKPILKKVVDYLCSSMRPNIFYYIHYTYNWLRTHLVNFFYIKRWLFFYGKKSLLTFTYLFGWIFTKEYKLENKNRKSVLKSYIFQLLKRAHAKDERKYF